MKPNLSIIIVNYRSWGYLKACLTSLNDLDNNYEVIVVDNFSDDGQLVDFEAKWPKVKFISSTDNLGFGAGCHLGTLHALGEYILFLNPDTEANEKALAVMQLFLQENKNYGIVSCQQHNNLARHHLLFPSFWRLFGLFRAIISKLRAKKFSIKSNIKYSWIEPDWVSASVLMISKKNYEAVGGYSKKLWMYFEDPDLCKRVSQMGLKIALLNTVKIYHKHGGATRLNLATASLTKTEVTISRHVYINEHFGKTEKKLSHIVLIISFLLFGTALALLGYLLYSVPKMKLQTMIWRNRMAYYWGVLKTGNWLSPRLVKH